MSLKIFEREEKKYLINENQYQQLLKKINTKMRIDEHGYYSLFNIYFDTDNFDLITTSLEKPIYKEKVRLRSYTIPNLDSTVFLELKKKYKGIVYKRRIELKLKEFYDYYYSKQKPINSQIMNEIDYIFEKYNLKPKVFLAYDRCAYFDIENDAFRITFDKNIRSRFNDLFLEKGDFGNKFKNDKYIMEVKALNSLPLWFIKILDELHIYPSSFSKYGEVYKEKIKGDVLCLKQC